METIEKMKPYLNEKFVNEFTENSSPEDVYRDLEQVETVLINMSDEQDRLHALERVRYLKRLFSGPLVEHGLV